MLVKPVELLRVHRTQELLQPFSVRIVGGHHVRVRLTVLAMNDGVYHRIKGQMSGRRDRLPSFGMAQQHMQEFVHDHRLGLRLGMGMAPQKAQIDQHAWLRLTGDGQRRNRVCVFDLQDLQCSPDGKRVLIDQFLQQRFKVCSLHW